MPIDVRRVTVPGGQVAVQLSGTGRPILFVHGAGGDRHNWDGVIEMLRDRFTCVAVDRAGYGESTWEAEEPPNREDHGQHLIQVVADLGLQDACAVGTSGGAITILAALRTDPKLFAGVILVEPPLHIDDGTSEAPTGRAGSPPAAPEGDGDLMERGVASIRRLDPVAWDGMSPENRERYIASFATMFRETSQPMFVITEQELAAMTAPAAVVYGSTTPQRLADCSRNLAAALPNSELRVVEGAAHLMYLTHTQEVAGLIGAFAEGVTPDDLGSDRTPNKENG